MRKFARYTRYIPTLHKLIIRSQWINLYKEGMSTTQIAEFSKVARQTVTNHLIKSGVKLRKKRPYPVLKCPHCDQSIYKKELVRIHKPFLE